MRKEINRVIDKKLNKNFLRFLDRIHEPMFEERVDELLSNNAEIGSFGWSKKLRTEIFESLEKMETKTLKIIKTAENWSTKF